MEKRRKGKKKDKRKKDKKKRKNEKKRKGKKGKKGKGKQGKEEKEKEKRKKEKLKKKGKRKKRIKIFLKEKKKKRGWGEAGGESITQSNNFHQFYATGLFCSFKCLRLQGQDFKSSYICTRSDVLSFPHNSD